MQQSRLFSIASNVWQKVQKEERGDGFREGFADPHVRITGPYLTLTINCTQTRALWPCKRVRDIQMLTHAHSVRRLKGGNHEELIPMSRLVCTAVLRYLRRSVLLLGANTGSTTGCRRAIVGAGDIIEKHFSKPARRVHEMWFTLKQHRVV